MEDEKLMQQTIDEVTRLKSGTWAPDTISELTDARNAERLAEEFGNRIRFDHKRGRWLVWGEHRWIPDVEKQVQQMAIQSARNLYVRALEIKDRTDREKVSKWATRSESSQGVQATLSLAKSVPPISSDGCGYDQHNTLLCVTNGVVDLTSGDLRDGKPEDLITQAANVFYDPGAECPMWFKFISEVFENNNELIHYVHKSLGYTITGLTSEQCAFFCFGTGSNGKSVFFKTIQNILGDYSHTAPASLFQRSFNTNTNDVAATENKRFLVTSETLSTTKLNEQRLKSWTGGDTVSARYLYSEFFTFEPTVKPWLFINHKPQVEDDSYGFWRRVRLIPFNRVFTLGEQDQELTIKLKSEYSGILNWLIKGCLLWQQEKLRPTPGVVASATEAYQVENDQLADFLYDKYSEPVKEVKAMEIYKNYREWAESQGFVKNDILSSTSFGRRMSDKFKRGRTMVGNVYFNVGFQKNVEAACRVDPHFTKTPYRDSRVEGFKKTPPNPTYPTWLNSNTQQSLEVELDDDPNPEEIRIH